MLVDSTPVTPFLRHNPPSLDFSFVVMLNALGDDGDKLCYVKRVVQSRLVHTLHPNTTLYNTTDSSMLVKS